VSNWGDKYIEFFIANYDDIKELNKLSEWVKGRLPSELDSDMKKCIYRLQSEAVKVDCDKTGIWWFFEDEDQYGYKEEKNQGLWFCYEHWWDRLFSDNDSEEVTSLRLYVSTGQFRKKAEKRKYIDNVISELKKKSDILRQNDIRFAKIENYEDEDIPVLEYQFRKEDIMSVIVDRAKLRDAMQKAVGNFTETVRSILKPTHTPRD